MSKSYWNGKDAVHRRVMMKAAGYSDEDIKNKPHIGEQIHLWRVLQELHI